MKIALIGYGKMGRSIEAAAIERNHEIVLKADVDINVRDLSELLRGADVAIEFSVPSAAPANILACFEADVPVVTGTTGWKDQFENIKSKCEERKGSLFYASNFSIGMNLMFALNKYMAKMTGNQNQYKISLEEIHHTQKLDAPSGTAITLADDIIKNHP
ncbi:MAG: dihydrodipicolinate reductase C-terminal domain-containing protein, partial [Bacteroidota bacterium]